MNTVLTQYPPFHQTPETSKLPAQRAREANEEAAQHRREDARQAAQHAAQASRQAIENAPEAARDFMQRVSAGVEDSKAYMRNNPVTTSLGAFALGVLLGYMARAHGRNTY